MSIYVTLGGLIVSAVGLITEGTSCAITGIQSTKEEGGDKATLQASSALVGFGTIIILISLIILFTYKRKPSKAKKITIIVMGILGILLLLIGALIAGIKSTQVEDPGVSTALRSAAVLVGVGLLLLVIGYIILYFAIGRKLNKTGGKMKL